MDKITIAIDGYSSTGKSTVAKQLASHLGYVYIDTGAMYRAVTLYALQKQYIGEGVIENIKALKEDLQDVQLHFKYNDVLGFAEIYLNGENVEKAIRTLHVSSYVSQIAAIKEVRSQLVAMQQKIGKDKGIVMDGRDIGTVVFPDAELKIFLTASPKIRAERRYKELIERGEKVTFEEVLQNVVERDRIDTTRAVSPLVRANDAIEIDNSEMTLEAQFKQILSYIK